MPQTTSIELFKRPHLRDDVVVLHRASDTIQVGDVIIDHVSPAVLEGIRLIDGSRSLDQLVQSLEPDVSGDFLRVVRQLAQAAAIEDASSLPSALRWSAPQDRDSARARFAAAIDSYGDLAVAFDAMEARHQARIATVGTGIIAQHVTEALLDSGLTIAPPRSAGLVILADAHHPDVPESVEAPALETAHLHIGVLGRRAIVGPLVVPGRTSCLRCAHLHRRDRDPAWPLLAVQLSTALRRMAVPPVDPALSRLAATRAALLVRAWIDLPDDPTSWGDRALEITLPHGDEALLPRPPHPLCGCRWPETDPWRVKATAAHG